MTPQQKPNILLLFTDMQRHDTIAALGNPHIKTPHLDRLVNEGTAFTHAYSPSPVCVPARCCMHYGKHPQVTGLYENGTMPDDDGTSYVQRLTEAGYRSHAIGKLDFTPDPHALRGIQSRESQEEMVGKPDEDDYLRYLQAQGYEHVCDPHGARGEMYYIPQVAAMPAEHHPTQWIGDRSCAFIADEKRSQQPWYLMASFIHPHPPFNPPNPWHKLYRGPRMPLPLVPSAPEAHHTWANQVQNRYKYRDQGTDANLLRQIKAHYYACISFVDYQVGRILDVLEASGQADNTLILFSSDHGEHLGDYNCFGKRSMHDTSTRVPMIARFPSRIPAGNVCEEVTSLIDIASTCCAAAGIDCSGYDGLPLQEIARGDHQRKAVFSQFGKKGEAQYLIATTTMSYFYSAADDREYCYDKVRDPKQQHLLPTVGSINQYDIQELRNRLQNFLKEQGSIEALDPESAHGWKQYPVKKLSKNPDDGLIYTDHWWSIPQSILPGYSDPAQYRNLLGDDLEVFQREFPEHNDFIQQDIKTGL